MSDNDTYPLNHDLLGAIFGESDDDYSSNRTQGKKDKKEISPEEKEISPEQTERVADFEQLIAQADQSMIDRNDGPMGPYIRLHPWAFARHAEELFSVDRETVWQALMCTAEEVKRKGIYYDAFQEIRSTCPELHSIVCARIAVFGNAVLDLHNHPSGIGWDG